MRATPPQLIALRDGIRQSYNEDELKDICQNIGVDWGGLSGNFQAKTGQLVDHCQRKNIIEKLAAAVAELVTVEGLGAPAPAEQARSAEVSGPSKIKILMLAANPKDTDQLNIGKEARLIEAALRESDHRDKFELVTAWATKSTDFIREVLRHRPQILHYSGHGSSDGELCFEDSDGNTKPIAPEVMTFILDQFKDTIKIVLTNACYSAGQSLAIAKVIPVALGMKRPISDTAAMDFAVGFYQALGYGMTVEKAFLLAKGQVLMGDSISEDRTPKMVHREDVDPATMKLF